MKTELENHEALVRAEAAALEPPDEEEEEEEEEQPDWWDKHEDEYMENRGRRWWE